MGASLWQLYGIYALMSLLGTGAGAVAWTSLLAGNFDKARGLALGVGLSGTGLCSILMPAIAAASMAQWGWRGAYVSLAAFCLLVVLPICWLVLPRDRPGAQTTAAPIARLSGLDVSEAVRSARFWQLGLSTFAIYAVIGGTIPNLVPAFVDAGLSMTQAASIMGIFGMTVIGGRIAVGALVDHFWAPAVAALVMVPAAMACLIIGGGGSYASFAIAAAMLGVATGTELDVMSYLVARYFGMADFARIYGLRLYLRRSGIGHCAADDGLSARCHRRLRAADADLRRAAGPGCDRAADAGALSRLGPDRTQRRSVRSIVSERIWISGTSAACISLRTCSSSGEDSSGWSCRTGPAARIASISDCGRKAR